jgi:hypothetical protein
MRRPLSAFPHIANPAKHSARSKANHELIFQPGRPIGLAAPKNKGLLKGVRYLKFFNGVDV